MLDELSDAPRTLGRPPSPDIAALDREIRTRYKKRTDSLESFLREWIRLDESQTLFFGARGVCSENFLQYQLSAGDMQMSLALAKMCAFYAESTDAERIIGFLNHIDKDGNDIWHYLADNLTSKEDDEGLELAQILIQLEIDYCRKNDNDESPLARLLIPRVKWQSVNSLLQAKTLTVEEMEASFSTKINANPQVKAEIMVNIFVSDLTENDGRLTSHILHFAGTPKAEKEHRAAIARVLFEYAGGKRQESVLMRAVETPHKELFDKMLELMQRAAEEHYAASTIGDVQLAKASHQLYIYRRLARRNRIFQNIVHKAVALDKPNFITSAFSMLRFEELVLLKRNARGETEREVLVVDKTSPAPSNPALSFLLQQDARGNLTFHNAVLNNRLDCLRKLFVGLSQVDVYAILCRIPNRYNLTVADLLTPKDAYDKLTVELKAQRISMEDAQALLGAIKKLDKRVVEYMSEILKKAYDIINRTGGVAAAKPTFDLSKIPTVQLAMQNRKAAPPAQSAAR